MGLTRENEPDGINKGQVALKKVQPLHEIPLQFPYEIDLHFESKDVVPKEHHTRHHCPESQKGSIASPIAEFTFKILPVG